MHPSCSSYFLTNSSSSWIQSDTSATFFALSMDSALLSTACAPVPFEGCTPGRVFARRSVHHLVCRLLQSFLLFRWSSLIDRQRCDSAECADAVVFPVLFFALGLNCCFHHVLLLHDSHSRRISHASTHCVDRYKAEFSAHSRKSVLCLPSKMLGMMSLPNW